MFLRFSDPAALDVALVDGKGYGFARAAQHHLPVPDGVVLTTQAYCQWFAPHRDQVMALMVAHSDAQAQSNAICTYLDEQPLPDSLTTALRDWQDRQPQRCFAVRSSGSAEDLPGAAFAGLHDTFLNVRGVTALSDAVKRCWLSLWNAAVLPYRERLGVAHDSAAMAVVIQHMVDVGVDEAAGVAFSIDPVGGDVDVVLINAAFGLGETVVAGEAPVDEYRVDRDGTIRSRSIACKTTALIRAEEGNQKVAIGIKQQSQAAITPKQAAQIAALARQAEARFGFPQDIEWAIERGALYLLQSRPVTRFAPRWTRDESAERFPNPVTPLTWQLCEKGFHASLNYSFELMGLPPFHDKWFALKDGYVYGNQNAVAVYAGRMPFNALKDTGSLAAFIEAGGLWQFAWISDLPLRWLNDLDAYLLSLGRFNAIDYQGKTLAQCWQHLLTINNLGTRYFLPNIAISLTQTLLYRVLRTVLQRFVGAEAQTIFDQLIAVTDTKTAAVNAAMWRLSRLLRQYPALMQQRFHDRDSLQQALDEYDAFAQALDAFLQQHGHREVDFDAYHPTWLEAPHTVFAQIQMMAAQEDDDRERTYWRKKDTMLATELQLLKRVPEAFRFFLQELIRLARSYTALDDIEHYQTTRLTLPFRRAAREIGKRLVNLGALDTPMDVFFLPPDALAQAIENDDFSEIRSLALKHKTAYQQAQQRSPDWVYGQESTHADDGDQWQGLAGSPGVVEGEVFVITDPAQFADFPQGAILVARTTNPAWTPLFYHAKGVITESGGPLSHGAVTARELGIAAVMSIRDACTRLSNGQRVRLDGQRGVVIVLNAEDERQNMQ